MSETGKGNLQSADLRSLHQTRADPQVHSIPNLGIIQLHIPQFARFELSSDTDKPLSNQNLLIDSTGKVLTSIDNINVP
jgi:hypothetical protein